MVFGNDDQPTHSWTMHDGMGESVMDLSVANQPFGKWMISYRSHPTGSDQGIIECDLEM